ncbi:MAG: hypothetical protein DLM66_00060 [Candidatus Dormiibacter spiritus]|nr:MAG: hypothetical protein DLM66_00060 [Candidatus Dormibacteraeota bacterium]
MAEWYILEGHDYRAARSDEVGLQTAEERTVQKTRVGDTRISTVFLGLDHGLGDYPPILFETMVFGGPLDGEMDRYSTWDQAEAGHEQMVERVQAHPPLGTEHPSDSSSTSS